MNILITGASGFIGGRLIDYLIHQGVHKVFYSSSNFMNLIEQFPSAHNLSLDWNALQKSFNSLSKIDVLIHCAGVNSGDSERRPKYADYFNHLVTRKLADISAKAGVKKFLYLSTAHIYNSNLEGEISENSIPKNNHPYARSHYLGEMALLDVARNNNMQAIVLRLSNVFGVPVNANSKGWGLVVNDLCCQAAVKKTMILKTNGLVKRDFISIDEVLKVINFFIVSNIQNNKANVFNIGSGVSRSVLEVANLINKINYDVFGEHTPIIKNISDKTPPNNDFQYKTLSLDKVGVKVVDNISEVIESLLVKCYKNYPGNR